MFSVKEVVVVSLDYSFKCCLDQSLLFMVSQVHCRLSICCSILSQLVYLFVTFYAAMCWDPLQDTLWVLESDLSRIMSSCVLLLERASSTDKA